MLLDSDSDYDDESSYNSSNSSESFEEVADKNLKAELKENSIQSSKSIDIKDMDPCELDIEFYDFLYTARQALNFRKFEVIKNRRK